MLNMFVEGAICVHINVVDERTSEVTNIGEDLLDDRLEDLRQWRETERSTLKHPLCTTPGERGLVLQIGRWGELKTD
jgi:hypothetical protein